MKTKELMRKIKTMFVPDDVPTEYVSEERYMYAAEVYYSSLHDEEKRAKEYKKSGVVAYY